MRTFLLASVVASLLACSHEPPPAPAPKSTLPENLALAAEPAGARAVKDVVADAKEGDAVVVVGRVGEEGTTAAFFRLVDVSLKACSEGSAMDDCPTPWDFCCTPPDEMRAISATVEFRDGDRPRAGSVLGFHGLDHLKTVVVQGKAAKDSAGNLTIVADGVWVRP